MQETYETLAAVAVFRELYDQNKDIYDVLSSYIVDIINSQKLFRFTRAELTDKLNEINSFDISESIIKTVLKKMKIEIHNGIYDASNLALDDFQETVYYRQNIENNQLLYNLYSFFSKEWGRELSDIDKNMIKDSFFEYLVHSENNDDYKFLINKYIMSLDPHFLETINKIKEGILIYEGVCYNGNLNELGKWKTKLNIYLEQEVLFYLAGYNGEVHKDLYNEMLSYVMEINKDLPQDKRWINLWYTNDVKIEIDAYFSTAERILEKKEVIDPSKNLCYIF